MARTRAMRAQDAEQGLPETPPVISQNSGTTGRRKKAAFSPSKSTRPKTIMSREDRVPTNANASSGQAVSASPVTSARGAHSNPFSASPRHTGHRSATGNASFPTRSDDRPASSKKFSAPSDVDEYDMHMSSSSSFPLGRPGYDKFGNLVLGDQTSAVAGSASNVQQTGRLPTPPETQTDEGSDMDTSEADDTLEPEPSYLTADEREAEREESNIGGTNQMETELSTTPVDSPSKSWGFASLIPSAARAATRFIASPFKQTHRAPNTPSAAAAVQNEPQRLAMTEPRRSHISITQGRPNRNSLSGSEARRTQSQQSAATLLTRNQQEERQARKAKRQAMEEEIERLMRLQDEKDRQIRELQARAQANAENAHALLRADAEALAELQSWPARKRKRSASPEIIPTNGSRNCSGSFGIDLKYITYSDTESESGSESDNIDATFTRMNKRQRRSTSTSLNRTPLAAPTSGDPKRAQPYLGKTFLKPGEQAHATTPTNLFSAQAAIDARGASPPSSPPQPTTPTPSRPHSNHIKNQLPTFSSPNTRKSRQNEGGHDTVSTTPKQVAETNSFSVPSPESQSSDDDTEQDAVTTPTRTPDATPRKQQHLQAAEHVGQATLSPTSEMALQRQRELATKYSSKTPSRLQQSSLRSLTPGTPVASSESSFDRGTTASTLKSAPSQETAIGPLVPVAASLYRADMCSVSQTWLEGVAHAEEEVAQACDDFRYEYFVFQCLAGQDQAGLGMKKQAGGAQGNMDAEALGKQFEAEFAEWRRVAI